jgi:hypothetical protein
MTPAMRQSRLYDKVLGCLLGGAIGDAFGIRLEMMHYRDIEAQYGRVTHFDALPPRQPSTQPPLERFQPFGSNHDNPGGFHPLGRWSRETGVYTDDTRYQLLVCQAILRKGDPITGADLAAEWFNYRLSVEGAVGAGPTWRWTGPEQLYARLLAPLERLVQMSLAQRPYQPGWDAPIGLIHAGDPQGAAAVASPFAVAIATAMMPGATIDSVIANTITYASAAGENEGEFAGRMTRLVEIAANCPDVFALREPFYREFLVTFPPWDAVFSLEIVPCALALSLVARGDPEQAIIGAANLGRDCDTIACMAGGLTGALHGASALPAAWAEQVLRLNPEPDLAKVAEDLCHLMMARAHEQQRLAGVVLDQAALPSPGA